MDATELRPVGEMTREEIAAELAERGHEPPSKANEATLTLMLEGARRVDESEPSDGEPEEIEGEATEVEPTPEEAAGEHATAPVAERLKEAEYLALELREKAVGPQQTIPALAELNAIRAIATQLANSGIVPEAYRRRPDDVVAAVLMGRELGIGPMQSLKDIFVIDGKPALAAHLQLAILRRGGIVVLDSSVDDERAWIKARRSDTGETAEIEWRYEDATKIADRKGRILADKANWKNYRQDMLWARAVGRLTRRLGPDLVAGMPYTAEEVQDFDDSWEDPYGYGDATAARAETPTRVEDAPGPPPPRSATEIAARLGNVIEPEDAREWLIQAVQGFAGVPGGDSFGETWAALSSAQKNELGQKLAGVVLDLEERESGTGADLRWPASGARDAIAAIFAKRLGGIALVGPPWSLGPDEPDLPKRPESERARRGRERVEALGASESAGATENPSGEAVGREQPAESDPVGFSSEVEDDLDADFEVKT